MANTSNVIKNPPLHYHTVLIRILDRQALHVQGFFYEDTGDWVCLPPCTLDALPTLKEEAKVLVVIPGALVRFTEVSLPSQYSAKQLPQIVKYALEENLLTDVEDNHFAIFNKDLRAEKVCAGIIEKSVLKNYVERLQKKGIQPDVICSEADLLSSPIKNTWHIATTQDSVMVKVSDCIAGVVPIAQVQIYFEMLKKEYMLPETIYVTVIDEPLDARFNTAMNVFDKAHVKYINWTERLQDPHFLQDVSARNVLQGPFKLKKRLSKNARFWQLSKVLCACACLFLVVQQVWSYVVWHRLSHTYQNKIEAIYFSQFPEAKTVIEPKLRFDRVIKSLSEGGAGGAFWPLLSKLTQAMPPSKETLILQTLTYEKDKLSIHLSAKQTDVFKNFLAHLARLGVNVKEDKVVIEGETVDAVLILS